MPKDVQQAASQLLAARTPLAEGLNAGDLRQAFQKSGLFLEASLARGAMPSGTPDLKAARETTERYWFERALAKTGGNVMAASRLLGLTRNEGHYLYHLAVKGVPARPSRAKNPDAPANAARRRPRTRG